MKLGSHGANDWKQQGATEVSVTGTDERCESR